MMPQKTTGGIFFLILLFFLISFQLQFVTTSNGSVSADRQQSFTKFVRSDEPSQRMPAGAGIVLEQFELGRVQE